MGETAAEHERNYKSMNIYIYIGLCVKVPSQVITGAAWVEIWCKPVT